jgi:predicted DNA-binding transcriptional regulator AlpA
MSERIAAAPAGAAYLTQRDVLARYRISRTTLWTWRQSGGFPAPVQLGPSPTLRWRIADLLAWEGRR